jgi:hypothetical protein
MVKPRASANERTARRRSLMVPLPAHTFKERAAAVAGCSGVRVSPARGHGVGLPTGGRRARTTRCHSGGSRLGVRVRKCRAGGRFRYCLFAVRLLAAAVGEHASPAFRNSRYPERNRRVQGALRLVTSHQARVASGEVKAAGACEFRQSRYPAELISARAFIQPLPSLRLKSHERDCGFVRSIQKHLVHLGANSAVEHSSARIAGKY